MRGTFTSMSNYPTHPDRTITEPQKVGSVPCHRCGGQGFVAPWGVCFRCGGHCTDPTERKWLYPASWTDAQVEAWDEARQEKNRKARKRAAEKREAEARKVWDRNVERFPALATMDEKCREGDSDIFPFFAIDIRAKARRFDLSDRQGEAVTKAIEEALVEPEASDAPAWENGRQVVEGVIATRRFVENAYGGSMKLRILTDDGRGLWVTEPATVLGTDGEPVYIIEKGDRICLTATVEVSEDDPTFAFGKRPTKATLRDTTTDSGGMSRLDHDG